MVSYPYRFHGNARAIYGYVRRELPALSALRAIEYARHLAAIDRLDDLVTWQDSPSGDIIDVGAVEGLPVLIYVHVDIEPYDWGDYEPSDHDRERLEVIGVTVEYADGDGVPIQCLTGSPSSGYRRGVLDASCWGIGYLHGDARREALSHVLEAGYLDAARAELSERAYWGARDVVTVDA